MTKELEDLVASAKRAPAIAASVAQIRAVRYAASPECFEELLWILVAQAISTGRSIGMTHAHDIFSEVLAKHAEAPKA
jgi:hypothetical protein